MSFGFKTHSRTSAATCSHENQVTLEVAGLSRSVCESCGRVSVDYVADSYADRWDDEVGGFTLGGVVFEAESPEGEEDSEEDD